jgi:hypothetical protein
MACIEESKSLISRGGSRKDVVWLAGSEGSMGPGPQASVNLIFTLFFCLTLGNDVTCCGIKVFLS